MALREVEPTGAGNQHEIDGLNQRGGEFHWKESRPDVSRLRRQHRVIVAIVVEQRQIGECQFRSVEGARHVLVLVAIEDPNEEVDGVRQGPAVPIEDPDSQARDVGHVIPPT